ncbi:PREDICTED: uncharacterized protein LOC108546271 [Eufriesea mexicana]|uniref:uncharacterized protein LOC108546271 n=1 Tax=Eufriesea mexicana TaxID=516756 RepID=UPI00083C076C|nr:PREDICTED: uncharacterized protein LOC108546271 [Eufriesea mexicana]
MASLSLNNYPWKKNESVTYNLTKNKGESAFTATQIIFILLSIFGLFLAMLIYCKVCSRASSMAYSEYIAYLDEHNSNISSRSMYSDSIYESSMDRPPSYNEACSAPPLYTSPFNRVAMLEAPPVYPEIPTVSDRVSRANNHVFLIKNYI